MDPTKAKKRPKKVTPTYLDNYAAWYLERYNGSTQKLRQKLQSKLFLSIQEYGTDRQEAEAWIETLLQDYQKKGWLNDRDYAQRQAELLYRKGNSVILIRQKLKGKLLSDPDIEHALSWLRTEISGDQDYAAALRYAKRRRLGAFALPHKREQLAEKHYNSLRRTGFSHDLAVKILAFETEEALLEELFKLEQGSEVA